MLFLHFQRNMLQAKVNGSMLILKRDESRVLAHFAETRIVQKIHCNIIYSVFIYILYIYIFIYHVFGFLIEDVSPCGDTVHLGRVCQANQTDAISP